MDIVVFFGILLFMKFVGDSFNILYRVSYVYMWIIVTSLRHFNRGNLYAMQVYMCGGI